MITDKFENARLIKLPFYTENAREILDSVLGQLSDGWGENNPRWDKYWPWADVIRGADGQVIIKVSTENGEWDNCHGRYGAYVENAFKGMTDKDILEWFAKMILKTVKMQYKDDTDRANKDGAEKRTPFKGLWSEYSNYESYYIGRERLGTTFGDCYIVYSFLTGKNLKSFGNTERVVGECRTQDARDKVTNARLRLAEITKEFSNFDKETKVQIENLKKQIEKLETERRHGRDALWRKYAEERESLNEIING